MQKDRQSMPYIHQYKIIKPIISFSSTNFLSDECQLPSSYLPGHICHLKTNVTSYQYLVERLNWFPLPVAGADEQRITLQMILQKI